MEIKNEGIRTALAELCYEFKKNARNISAKKQTNKEKFDQLSELADLVYKVREKTLSDIQHAIDAAAGELWQEDFEN